MEPEAELALAIEAALKNGLTKAFGSTVLIEKGKPLYYDMSLNENLTFESMQFDEPKAGKLTAYQTDLCVIEQRDVGEKTVWLPRVVLELKNGVHTHDVLTYGAKARKHKLVYPWLRYGLLARKSISMAKFLRHNDGIDFHIGSLELDRSSLETVLLPVITEEVKASRELQNVIFKHTSKPQFFRQSLELR